MVFVIAMQGYYAARPDLRKEVMEHASVVLIGMVVVAIALARTAPEFNLILGPFRASDYPELAAYINIPVALWITVLLAYFPAVLQQRVPWMPIGLAVALVALPQETSTLPWVLSMIVIPYMVFISKVARAWVINITLLAFSASYLMSDWIGIEGLSPKPRTEARGCTCSSPSFWWPCPRWVDDKRNSRRAPASPCWALSSFHGPSLTPSGSSLAAHRLHVHHELQHDGVHQDPLAQGAQGPDPCIGVHRHHHSAVGPS